jgi:hypothetical protein
MAYVINLTEVISMPRGDGTGPMGLGPFTGRGMGNCIARGAAGIGLGLGLGLGCRRGFRRWFGRSADTYFGDPNKEKELLLEEIKFLKDRIEALDKKAEDQ